MANSFIWLRQMQMAVVTNDMQFSSPTEMQLKRAVGQGQGDSPEIKKGVASKGLK